LIKREEITWNEKRRELLIRVNHTIGLLLMSTDYYGHHNIIKYCDRPFKSIEEMDSEIIKRFNSVVRHEDCVIHAGDFTLNNREHMQKYITQLNGQNIFLKGSHDYWLPKNTPTIWEKKIEDQYIVVCHYPLLSWPRSYHGSIMLHGHSHGKIPPYGRRMDVGVDTNNFYPYSFDAIHAIMDGKEKGGEYE